ncbi:disease resistance protein Roq1-like [Cornus florida]|uniref:disease resistance protein Roq1-like n=1 Tax=Cornus florida TaxID=4283 RepID=UPI00289AFC01|nr:disease resistance protein Roq1-like [Cornus florida]
MAASSSSSSSSSLHGSEYDVFLSFRGEDTRKTFVGHLYTALDQRGIRTFKDEERLERGKSISSEMVKNINESRIGVIVFSKNYASSSWCLDELVEILECRRTKGQIVLPIFYHVKASRVRYQKRSFAEAFRQHEENYKEDMERVKRWRDALKEAANLSGLDLQDAANGYEDKFIKNIVQVILEKLQPKPFRVAKYEVGIDARVDKIITLLDEDQLFVGICGIGGAGKTTVAKAVFNRKSKDFERSCFLEKVREELAKDGGLAKLQTKLLRETLRDQTITISDPDRGINEIKDRLGNKRFLLVLDDVDDQNMLQYFVEQEWFCSGSRIILTTRDKQLLEKYNVRTYHLKLLNESEALQLFSCHAFKREKPEDDYEELSHRAKDYAKGLPLALQVLGSLLYKRGKQYWSSILDKLKTNPPKEIKENVYRVLKISYEGLNEEEKDIFLDIACFFNGCHKKYVMNVSKLPESDVAVGIQILNERSLINMSEKNVVLMHDLIQEMGRGIVRQESKEPRERSRLWSCDDICHVFAENMVTEKIEAIMLPNNGLSLEGGLYVRADAFTKMRKLRILKINGVRLDGCLTDLSNELRYLEWDGYPQEYLPYNFHPKRHVQLHLPNSLIKGICTNSKVR